MKKKKQMRNIAIGVIAVLVLVVVFALAFSKKEFKAEDTYVVINDREYTKQEFDYFFYGCANDFSNTYGEFATYLGLDIEGDLSKQQFSKDKTWEEYFYDMTLNMLEEYYVLRVEAEANGFEFDTDDSYENWKAVLENAALSDGMTVEEYYQKCYGPYATVENVEALTREVHYVNAYKEYLVESQNITDADIEAAYEAAKENYDSFSYRTFVIEAETTEGMTEEQKKTALDEAKKLAEEFVDKVKDGADFNELCLEYAPAEQKSLYENNGSLAEGVSLTQVSDIFKDWLCDESRKKGDIEIFDNEDYAFYAVAMFEERFFNEEGKVQLKEELASGQVAEKIADLKAELVIVHKK